MGCGPRQHVLTVGSSTNGVVRSKLIKFVITCATVTLGQYITKRYFYWKNSPHFIYHLAHYAYSVLCKILTFRGPCIVIYMLILKTNEMHNFSNLFS
jgi:hypothetical protein